MQTIRRIVLENPMELVWPSLIFLAILGVGWVVRRLVMRALRSWTARTKSRAGLILTESLRGPILIWTLILAVHLALQVSELPVRITDYGSRVLLVLWIVSFTIMFVRVAGSVVRLYGDQVPGALPVTTLTENLAQLTVVLIGIVLLLKALGLEITPMLTALGVGGLAVALAMQDTLSNLFAGFYIAVARQIRLGDYIKLNTGEEGYVGDITWRSTTIRGLGNNMVIIPNAKLAQAIVTNYYLPEKRMSASLQVSVSYDSDEERIEQMLLEIVKKGVGEIPGLLGEPAPGVTLDPGFGDSGISFSVGFQVAEFAQQYGVRHELRKRILRRFRAEGIQMPFPTRTLYLHGDGIADETRRVSGASTQER
ncbi:MAG TPA: mechanosensitive ion channel family protein [Bryobacteraceae bacterium]|nr:mechanosensitive ion channel family protein [Bryobacteraceae bacterium]